MLVEHEVVGPHGRCRILGGDAEEDDRAAPARQPLSLVEGADDASALEDDIELPAQTALRRSGIGRIRRAEALRELAARGLPGDERDAPGSLHRRKLHDELADHSAADDRHVLPAQRPRQIGTAQAARERLDECQMQGVDAGGHALQLGHWHAHPLGESAPDIHAERIARRAQGRPAGRAVRARSAGDIGIDADDLAGRPPRAGWRFDDPAAELVSHHQRQ